MQVNTKDCWLYAKSINTDGYGVILAGGKQYRAHRVMYENLVGDIPSGLQIDHLCRVRACINPEHLEAVDQTTNTLRGVAPSAINARKTHCYKGHEFTPENTLVRKSGWRSCRKCKRKWENGYYYKVLKLK